MDNLLKVEQRQQYGATVLYPQNGQAKRICALLGTKTLPMTKVAELKTLGFIFVSTAATPSVAL